MLNIGSFPARHCQGVSRRAFLKAGLAVPLAGALGSPSVQGATAKVRSVLLLWLWGGPSHLDTFDPKPNAPAEYRGPFATIATRTPGVRFTELFPRLAARSDRFALVRSNRNLHSGHLEAGSIGLTGDAGGVDGHLPNFGSILARHRGDRQKLPPFIAVGRGQPRDVVGLMKGYGGGSWGRIYDPFQVACSDRGEVDIPALQLAEGLTPQHLANRRTLLAQLDAVRRQFDAPEQRLWDATQRRAYDLLLSPAARQAFDLSRESEKTREAYGRTSFGQSCLLARRLVEAGVPYVQVNWSQYVEAMTPNCDFGWDTHIYNFDLLMDRHGPILDRVLSTLLDDLEQRGLLRSTLLVCLGEFGRTPKINGQASRDHWPNCYFSIWAGGPIQPGRVLGESDRVGAEPVTEPILPSAVGASILEWSGVDSQARAELRVLPEGRVLHELC
ncbi:MAG: DUF1501 domain-containing protein [Gemmataceae bacterium]|nr:DUF1501 domain-containing protein [Gemmataceae bacterium]MDW8265566.1 DUF1501 domain-containing protein [Gemmataceae bacterium]